MSHPADDASSVSGDAHGALRPLPTAESNTARLAERARRDLAALAHPAAAWVRPALHASGQHVFDVLIVGAGQSGLIIGLALKREGVCNVLLLDRNQAGYEGPWETFARMAVLRSPKAVVGAELGIPSLSVRTWFEARYGAEAWERITWIPRQPGLYIHADSACEQVDWTGDAIAVTTKRDRFVFDFVISATGVSFDLGLRPELNGIIEYIALWSDRFVPEPREAHAELGKLPYLGKSYEFLEKLPGAAPWLGHIYAFNFSAMASMGPVAAGISGHRYSVPRVVRGITESLFLEQADTILPDLRGFAEPEIDPSAAAMFSSGAAGFGS